MEPVSIYIHIPFCAHRCSYCDFNSYAGQEQLIPSYTQAVCKEISMVSSKIASRLPVKTIYFGGGTPSLFPAQAIEMILSSLYMHFHISGPIEISFEANPGTVSLEYIKQLQSLGINRISFGMQSMHQDELALLERLHSYKDVENAVEWSRSAGIKNINLDLIYGLPFQRLAAWRKNLEAALSLYPEHLSLYALTIEAGTSIYHKIKKGLVPFPDDDIVADMYEYAAEKLDFAGYKQYEISNWARRDHGGELYHCKHNLQYWQNLPYIGLGAGAHGFINHQRYSNVLTPHDYISRMNSGEMHPTCADNVPCTPATCQTIFIDTDTEIGESMMMGLRLVIDGVSNQTFFQRYGQRLQQRFGNKIARLIDNGLLEWGDEEHDVLRLTKRGRLLGNQVFREFI